MRIITDIKRERHTTRMLMPLAMVTIMVLSVTTAIVSAAPSGTTPHAAARAPINKLLSPPSVQWDKMYPGVNKSQWTFANSVKQTRDGGYILAGSISGLNYPSGQEDYLDAYLLKTDAAGNKLWDRRFDGGSQHEDDFTEVQVTRDGGYIMVGTATLETPTEKWFVHAQRVWVVKTDANGNTEWTHYNPCIGSDYGESSYGYSIDTTSDGGYIVAGKTNVPGFSNSVFLFKLTSSGHKVWEKMWGGVPEKDINCEAYSVKSTTDGGCVVTGYRSEPYPDTYHANLWLIKVSADGTKQWDKVFPKAAGEGHTESAGRAVLQTADGGYVVAGVGNAFIAWHGQGANIWLFKTDANGNKLWDKVYKWAENEDGDVPFSIQRTRDGGYLVAAISSFPNNCHSDFLLLKTNADGNEQWHGCGGTDLWLEVFNGVPGAFERSLEAFQTSDGGYICACTTGHVVHLIKLGPEQ